MLLDMELRQHDRDYLAVLEDLDGEATTTEIRKRTDLNNRQVNYRHEKLAREGIVSLEVDNSLTADGAAGMRVATLTDDGWELIREGEAVEGKVEQTAEERLDELEREVEEVADELSEYQEEAYPWMNEVVARLRRLEDAYADAAGLDSMDEYADVEEYGHSD